jgi:hypothetical protein
MSASVAFVEPGAASVIPYRYPMLGPFSISVMADAPINVYVLNSAAGEAYLRGGEDVEAAPIISSLGQQQHSFTVTQMPPWYLVFENSTSGRQVRVAYRVLTGAPPVPSGGIFWPLGGRRGG